MNNKGVERIMNFKGDKLKQLRKSQRWTAKALSERLNTTKVSLYYWESGHHEPPMKTIVELSHIFNVPLAELYETGTSPDTTMAIKSPDGEKKFVFPIGNIDDFDTWISKQVISRINNDMKFLEDRLKDYST